MTAAAARSVYHVDAARRRIAPIEIKASPKRYHRACRQDNIERFILEFDDGFFTIIYRFLNHPRPMI